jgi:hypothetical protein
MKEAIEQIKEGINQSKSMGDRLPVPIFDRKDIHVLETKLRACGSTLFKRRYKIDFDNGDWIQIEYASKSPLQALLSRSNRSEVKVTCSDPSLNFTDSWEEKAQLSCQS